MFSNKAVADGAISFYIDHAVTARMSRYFYGASMFTSYDSSDPEHRRRSGKTYVAINGEKSLDAQFDIILPKVSHSCCVAFLRPAIEHEFRVLVSLKIQSSVTCVIFTPTT